MTSTFLIDGMSDVLIFAPIIGTIILADKIYRNRENLCYCKECGIRLSGPALGRPRKGKARDKTQDYLDECERVEVGAGLALQNENVAWDWLPLSCGKPPPI